MDVVLGIGPSFVIHYFNKMRTGVEIEPEALALGERLRGDGATAPEDLAALRGEGEGSGGLGPFIGHLLRVLRRRDPLLDLTEKTRLGSLFTFREVDGGIPVEVRGAFAPVSRSLARGGLSNVWGAASYPLAPEDYRDWPLEESELAPHYREVASALRLAEMPDSLPRSYPRYAAQARALPLNPASERLLDHWEGQAEALSAAGIEAGRARLAVRAEADELGVGCQACGRCLSGCPYDAIYSAQWSLRELTARPGFRLRDGLLVRRFDESSDGVAVDVVPRAPAERSGATPERRRYRALFLAAGTVSSLRIAAESLGESGPVRLQDNDLYLLPLWRTAGGPVPSAALRFSLNELALRLRVDELPVHLQVYALSDQVLDRVRPLLSALPAPVVRRIEALQTRLLLGFVYLPGRASAVIQARVLPATGDEAVGRVVIEQRSEAATPSRMRGVVRALWRNRRALGFAPLLPLLRSTPSGNSGGHLSGALGMAREPGKLSTGVDGRLAGTRRVYVVDGAAIPELPAQNSTFTLMANARRVATRYAVAAGATS